MRILHINCNYIGTKLHRIMISKLSALGVENCVYVPICLKNAVVEQDDAEVCISRCFKKWDRLAFDYKQHKIINDIEKKFDVSQFDCIHAYTLFTDGNAAKKLSEKYGIPYVVAVRGGTDINLFFRKMLYLRKRGISIMQGAQQVFFLADPARKTLFDNYVAEDLKEELFAKTRIIPNGIDDFWLVEKYMQKRDFDLSAKKINIVYAGNVIKRKNIPTTQKAVDILRERGYDASLTVVGISGNSSEAQKVRNHKYTKCYKAAPKEKLIKAYRNCDIFVMPSHSETFGLVYAEAMSQGLPVIYTRGQGFDGHFSDGLVGYAVDDRDPTDIADKIEKICERYDEISRSCTEHCVKFNWDDIAREYYSIYESIIASENA